MGERIRLPDGTYITIPDGLSPEEKSDFAARLARRFGIPAQDERAAPSVQRQRLSPGNPFADYGGGENPFLATRSGIMSINPSSVKPEEVEEPDDGTIAGAALQGLKNVPRGMQQYLLLARQGLAGITSPDRDTDTEQELRRKMQELMEGIDPRYQDSRLANLGLGLGQFGTMVGTSMIPFVGMPATVAGAAFSGAGQQSNRIHEYEQSTGEDVSAGKEMLAMGMGLGIGLTEIMPWAKAIKALRPATRMSGTLQSEALEQGLEETASAINRVKGNIIGSSIGQGILEGAQEAGAGYAQSRVALMYDEDAMADAYHDAMKEAVIGFDVGAVGNVLLHFVTRGKQRGLKNSFANVASESLSEAKERQLDSMTPDQVNSQFSGLLTSEDPEAVDLREKIRSGEAQDNLDEAFEQRERLLEEVVESARQKAARGELTAEQLQEAVGNYNVQLKEARDEYAFATDQTAFRKRAIEMYEAGELQGQPNARAPIANLQERIDSVERLGEVGTIVQNADRDQEITEVDAEVVATANVDTADRTTYPIGEVVAQIRARLRPKREDVGRVEREVVNQELVSLEQERRDLTQAIERTQETLSLRQNLAPEIVELQAKIDASTANPLLRRVLAGIKARVQPQQEDADRVEPLAEELTQEEIEAAELASTKDLGVPLAEVTSLEEQLENKKKSFKGLANVELNAQNVNQVLADKIAQTANNLSSYEQDLQNKRDQIEQTVDPENIERRVKNAYELLKLGNDDLLSIEERLITQQQRDALRALHQRFLSVRSVNEAGEEVVVPLPADVSVAEALAMEGRELVESDERLTVREVRELLDSIFTGGLAQEYDVGYDTSTGSYRNGLDWSRSELESDGPVVYKVLSVDENLAPMVVRGEGDQVYSTPVTEGMQLTREEFETAQAQVQVALDAEAEAEAQLTKEERAERKGRNTAAKAKLKKLYKEVDSLTKKIINLTSKLREARSRGIYSGLEEGDAAFDKPSEATRKAEKQRTRAVNRREKVLTQLIPETQQEILDTEPPPKRAKFKGTVEPSREARERAAGRKSQEQLGFTKRPFVNNAARIESGLDITPEESREARLTRDKILSTMLGARGLLDYAKLSGKHRDKPGEVELDPLEDVALFDAETKALFAEFEAALRDEGKEVTQDLAMRFMQNQGINADFGQFVGDTLGIEVGTVPLSPSLEKALWAETTEGERQAVIARILSSNIPQTTRKSYTTPSRIPADAGRNILAFFTAKTKTGKYKQFTLLNKNGGPSKNVVDLARANRLEVQETLDFIDRAVTAGVLQQKGSKVRFNTTQEFRADVDAKDTEKGREIKVLREVENLSEQQANDKAVAKKRLLDFKRKAVKALNKLGHGDVAVRVSVAADTIYAKVAETIADDNVIVDYQSSRGTDASLQDRNTMVLFNLSQMELTHPQREGESETDYVDRLVKTYALHEGAHLYFVKQQLSASERGVFARYGRKEFVPESVLPENTGPNKLTWSQWVRSMYPNLSEIELVEETTVRIMDALVQELIPQNKSAGRIGTIKRKLQDTARELVGASRASDLGEVMKIFSAIQSGELVRRQKAQEQEGNTTSIDGLKLIERASEDQLQELKSASRLGEAALRRVADEIIATRVDPETGATLVKNKDGDWVDTESGKKFESVSLMDSMLNDLKARKEIQDTPSISAPVLNLQALEAGQISPEALDTYFAFETQKEPPLKFFESTRAYQSRHGKQGSQETPQASVRRNTHRFLSDGPPSEDQISPAQQMVEASESHNELAPELQKETGQKYVSDGRTYGKHIKYTGLELFREKFLDKRLPMWKAEMAKQREKALRGLSQFSAAVAWRMHDNALNFLPGMLKYGPMSYRNGGFNLDSVYAVDPETGDFRRDENGNRIQVKGLREIIKGLTDNGIKMEEDVKHIVMARRILQAESRGQTDRVQRLAKAIDKDIDEALAKARAALAAFDADVANSDPEALLIKQFMQEYSDFNFYLIEFAHDSGMITREQKEDFQQSAYFPFYRDQGWQNSVNMHNSNHSTNRGALMIDKALEGSTEPVSDDLTGMMIKNVIAITRDGMWNIAGQRTMRDVTQSGAVQDPDDPNKVWYDGIELTGEYDPNATAETLEALDGLSEKEIKTYREAKAQELSEAGYSNVVVTIKQDGITRKFRVKDPLLATSMMNVGFSAEQMIENFFGKVIQNERLRKGLTALAVKPAGFLRETVTKSPPFIAKNIVRDAWQASVTYGGGPQLLMDSIKNVFDAGAIEKAERAGLGIGIDWTPDMARAGEAETAATKPLSQLGTFEKAFEAFWMRPVWRPLSRVSQRSEIATRLAVYDRVLAETNGDATMAAYQAIEIMNYGRRGSSQFFNVITAMAPFLNGRIQGTDVVFRTMIGSRDVPGLYDGQTGGDFIGGVLTPSAEVRRRMRSARIATAVGRGAQLTMLTGLYYWMIKDEEEYKNAREDLKNDYWIFPGMGPAGTGIKIPIPFEVGVIFKTIPEQIARAIMEKEHDMRDVRNETARQVRATMSINLVPQVIRPFVDASIRNRNAFQRDNIVPSWMEDSVAATEQSNEYTNYLAVLTAGMLDEIPLVGSVSAKLGLTSPMKLEYIARQYVGTLGAYGLVAGDRVARQATKENYVGTAADFLGSSTMEIDRMPIVGDLLFDPGMGGGYQEDFYGLVEELDKIIATMGQKEKLAGGRDQGRSVFEYEEEQSDLLRHESRLKYLRRRMDKHRDRRQQLFDRRDLSDEDKRRMLYRMTEDRDTMLTEMLEIMADIRKDRSVYEQLFGRSE